MDGSRRSGRRYTRLQARLAGNFRHLPSGKTLSPDAYGADCGNSGEASGLATSVSGVIRTIDQDAIISNVQSMDQLIRRTQA